MKGLIVASYGDDSAQIRMHFKRKQSPLDTFASSFFDVQVSNTYVRTFTAYVGSKTKKEMTLRAGMVSKPAQVASARCPRGARTVPARCPHGARLLNVGDSNNGMSLTIEL